MPKSRKKTILIVDDATFIRNRIKKIVEKIENAEVIGEAANGEDAVSSIQRIESRFSNYGSNHAESRWY